MNDQILLIGGFVEIIELCEENDVNIIGIVDNSIVDNYMGIPIIGNDDNLKVWRVKYLKSKLIITPDTPNVRKKLFLHYEKQGFQFANLISKNARISKSASIDLGTVVQAESNISSEVKIGKFVKVNTMANIMHNSTIGNFTTIAPNAVILGHVRIGESCYIGANATILPHVSICDNVVVGAGAVVTKNIETPNSSYVGVPAYILKK